jgi:hypothetical protein
MWAVNSGCSVIASILVIPLAQMLGFQLVMLLATAIYIVGALVGVMGSRPEAVAKTA